MKNTDAIDVTDKHGQIPSCSLLSFTANTLFGAFWITETPRPGEPSSGGISACDSRLKAYLFQMSIARGIFTIAIQNHLATTIALVIIDPPAFIR
jgi:hypothetical protein